MWPTIPKIFTIKLLWKSLLSPALVHGFISLEESLSPFIRGWQWMQCCSCSLDSPVVDPNCRLHFPSCPLYLFVGSPDPLLGSHGEAGSPLHVACPPLQAAASFPIVSSILMLFHSTSLLWEMNCNLSLSAASHSCSPHCYGFVPFCTSLLLWH